MVPGTSGTLQAKAMLLFLMAIVTFPDSFLWLASMWLLAVSCPLLLLCYGALDECGIGGIAHGGFSLMNHLLLKPTATQSSNFG